MLSKAELKGWLQRDITRQEKLLLLLSTFDEPCSVQDVRDLGKDCGFRIPAHWNMADILSKPKGMALRLPKGWEITEGGKSHLRNLGVSKVSPAAVQVAVDLRAELANIKNKDTQRFVDEAIKCYEMEFYRSAVVMSWLAAVHVLHNEVVSNHLHAFNVEAKRIEPKWKTARNADDLGRMKESDFLERLVGLSIIGRNVKKELKDCLDRRNGCGHPNSMKIGANYAAHHLEVLLLNVFKVF